MNRWNLSAAAAKRIADRILDKPLTMEHPSLMKRALLALKEENIVHPERELADLIWQFGEQGFTHLAVQLGRECAIKLRHANEAGRELLFALRGASYAFGVPLMDDEDVAEALKRANKAGE